MPCCHHLSSMGQRQRACLHSAQSACLPFLQSEPPVLPPQGHSTHTHTDTASTTKSQALHLESPCRRSPLPTHALPRRPMALRPVGHKVSGGWWIMCYGTVSTLHLLSVQGLIIKNHPKIISKIVNKIIRPLSWSCLAPCSAQSVAPSLHAAAEGDLTLTSIALPHTWAALKRFLRIGPRHLQPQPCICSHGHEPVAKPWTQPSTCEVSSPF